MDSCEEKGSTIISRACVSLVKLLLFLELSVGA